MNGRLRAHFPPPSPVTPGINYGNFRFSEPRLFPALTVPPFEGIYAILVTDMKFRPRPFRLLYIGETGDLGRDITLQHEKLDDWTREAHGHPLFVAWHTMISASSQQRRSAELELINVYRPPCNARIICPVDFSHAEPMREAEIPA